MLDFLKPYFKFSFQSIGAILIILYLIFAPSVIFSSLSKTEELINRQIKLDYYGVLELWNIDSFEGGSASRSSWLERRSLEFEKIYKGTFIIVRNMTEEQAILNLQNGNKPNLISYSLGLGHTIIPYLTNFTGSTSVRDDLKKSGTLNGNFLAVPYLLGGYTLMGSEQLLVKHNLDSPSEVLEQVFSFSTTRNKKNVPSLIFGANMYINPALALSLNTLATATKNDISDSVEQLSSYEAYEQYVLKDSASLLLGTQRDVYRCKNREANSNLSTQFYHFLEGFSDLVQYVSIFNTDAKTKAMCESFIEYLITPEVQKTLTDINMFSTMDMQIYYDSFYKEWEKVLNKPLKTLNVFLHPENIKEKIDLALKALSGDKSAMEKINNMF